MQSEKVLIFRLSNCTDILKNTDHLHTAMIHIHVATTTKHCAVKAVILVLRSLLIRILKVTFATIFITEIMCRLCMQCIYRCLWSHSNIEKMLGIAVFSLCHYPQYKICLYQKMQWFADFDSMKVFTTLKLTLAYNIAANNES